MEATDKLPSAPEAEDYIVRVAVGLEQYAADVFEHSGLSDLHFFDEARAATFKILGDQYRNGGIDLATAARELNKCRAFQSDKKAAGYLLGLKTDDQTATTGVHVPAEAAKIIEAAKKRQLFQIAEAARHAALNGESPADIRAALSADLWEFDRDTHGEPRDKFTLAELRSDYPTLNRPVIDGILRQRETLNLVSVSKVGKSWLAYNLAICNIVGEPWLGRYATSPGKVLLVDNELHRSTLAYRLPVVGNAMGIPRDEYEHDLEVLSLRGKLRSLADLANDVDTIEADKFNLIILDAKYRFAAGGESENDNASETRLYNLVDQLGERTGSAIVLIHHSTKGSQSDKRITDVGAGAGAQSRAADAHVVLREHADDGVVVLEAAVRSFAPVKPMALRWAFPLWLPDEQCDPARLKRQPSGNEQRQSDRDREGVDKIIKALRKGPSTARALLEKTLMGKGRQKRLLDWIVAEGHATTKEITIRGNECHEYTLRCFQQYFDGTTVN